MSEEFTTARVNQSIIWILASSQARDYIRSSSKDALRLVFFPTCVSANVNLESFSLKRKRQDVSHIGLPTCKFIFSRSPGNAFNHRGRLRQNRIRQTVFLINTGREVWSCVLAYPMSRTVSTSYRTAIFANIFVGPQCWRET